MITSFHHLFDNISTLCLQSEGSMIIYQLLSEVEKTSTVKTEHSSYTVKIEEYEKAPTQFSC